MDRFIGDKRSWKEIAFINLKSNMDRFIASVARTVVAGITYLKSNMDRFIENTCFINNNKSLI